MACPFVEGREIIRIGRGENSRKRRSELLGIRLAGDVPVTTGIGGGI
jgi:hypothetical protein